MLISTHALTRGRRQYLLLMKFHLSCLPDKKIKPQHCRNGYRLTLEPALLFVLPACYRAAVCGQGFWLAHTRFILN